MTEQRGGIKQTMGKMRDTVGGIAGKLSARNVDDANTLVEEAYIGDLYERLAACLALQRGSDAPGQALTVASAVSSRSALRAMRVSSTIASRVTTSPARSVT